MKLAHEQELLLQRRRRDATERVAFEKLLAEARAESDCECCGNSGMVNLTMCHCSAGAELTAELLNENVTEGWGMKSPLTVEY